MALQYVGGTSGAGTSTGYTVSLSGTLTGGLASSPTAGDIVVVASAFGNTASSAPAVSGNATGQYTGLGVASHANDTWDTEFRMFYAVMGATPDTTLTVTRATNAAYGGATVVQVWRGSHATTPIDVTGTPATTTNASRGNPPAVTPSVTGAVVIAAGAGTQAAATGAGFTVPGGMGNAVSVKGDGGTADIGVWIASADGTQGVAYDPPAWTGGVTSTSCSAAAQTIVLSPAPAPVETTGTIGATETGADAAVIAGKLPVSGALASNETGADSAVLAGSVKTTTSGSLAAAELGGDVAVIAGKLPVSGALASSETGADSAALVGAVPVKGALASNETGVDAATLAGSVLVSASLVAQEIGADSAAVAGSVFITGAVSTTEAGADVSAFLGRIPVAGSVTALETGPDAVSLVAGVLVSGSAAASESGSDTVGLSGVVLFADRLDATETGSDTAAMDGAVPVSGYLAAAGGLGDTSAILGRVRTIPVWGDLSAVVTGSTFAAASCSSPWAGVSAGSWHGTIVPNNHAALVVPDGTTVRLE